MEFKKNMRDVNENEMKYFWEFLGKFDGDAWYVKDGGVWSFD